MSSIQNESKSAAEYAFSTVLDKMIDVWSITFCEVGENGPGMEKYGAPVADGFLSDDFKHAEAYAKVHGLMVERVDLHRLVPPGVVSSGFAEILIVRNALATILGSIEHSMAFIDLLSRLPMDKQAIFRGVLKNKRARHNAGFADEAQEPDLVNGRGTIYRFTEYPYVDAIRTFVGELMGPKGFKLLAEVNHYHDKKAYIGAHGDAERKRVVCMRAGAAFKLCFQWFQRHGPIGERYSVVLNHGDMYVMGAKAVGNDWHSSKTPTLRHAASHVHDVKSFPPNELLLARRVKIDAETAGRKVARALKRTHLMNKF
jgi:hypothetical protein